MAGPQPDTAAQAEALNITGYNPPKIKEQDYPVRRDCWAAVEMFARIVGQPESGPVGVVSLEWLFQVYDVQEPRQMLEDLRTMERAWLEAVEQVRR